MMFVQTFLTEDDSWKNIVKIFKVSILARQMHFKPKMMDMLKILPAGRMKGIPLHVLLFL